MTAKPTLASGATESGIKATRRSPGILSRTTPTFMLDSQWRSGVGRAERPCNFPPKITQPLRGFSRQLQRTGQAWTRGRANNPTRPARCGQKMVEKIPSWRATSDTITLYFIEGKSVSVRASFDGSREAARRSIQIDFTELRLQVRTEEAAMFERFRGREEASVKRRKSMLERLLAGVGDD